jgi:hypothetical protein
MLGWYVLGTGLETQDKLRILELGAADVNGSYRALFTAPNVETSPPT